MYYNQADFKQTFDILRNQGDAINTKGRAIKKYLPTSETLDGTFARASEQDINKHKQKEHNISCTIIQEGAPIAKREDVLQLGERRFFVHDVKDPMNLGVRTVYVVEERSDLND